MVCAWTALALLLFWNYTGFCDTLDLELDLIWIKDMARSLREAIFDELLRLGMSLELIRLLFPERGWPAEIALVR